jgi:plasmid stabilization system protein ParE
MDEEAIYSFRFDTIAQEQLIEAVEYYNEHPSPENGKRFLAKIETIVELLCMWPEVAPHLDELPEVRSIKVPKYPYRLYYRINDSNLEVVGLSVYHTRRDLEALLDDLKKRFGTK